MVWAWTINSFQKNTPVFYRLRSGIPERSFFISRPECNIPARYRVLYHMKRNLQASLYCIILLCLFAGCAKKENSALYDAVNGEPAGEDIQIQQYLAYHNIKAQKDPSGLYYQVINYGDSINRISLENVPYMIYTRRLMDNTFIDGSIGATDFDGRKLKDHIAGWQIGLQKITKGGKILMIIPSGLGFGKIAVDKIPANSILVCEAELVDFK